MSKRCICEICTCGRHRCPHHSTNHLSQGDEACQLTEYANVYKAHPLGARESFKPVQHPMSGGEFLDKTTHRTDYKPHPMERPFVHQAEEYVKPLGDMENMTSYKQEYTEKHGAPVRAIRHEGQRPVYARFEGEPTYRADYKKWDGSGRQPAYNMQPAWEPPKTRFEGQTTFQHDYKRNEIMPRQSFRPSDGPKISNMPFEDRTTHRDAYVPHVIPLRFQHEHEEYKPSLAQFDDLTTFKRDYKGALGEPTHSFKPDGKAFHSEAPFDDDTTNRRDYKRWPMERPFVHAHEPYQKPLGEMDMNTTHNSTYRELPIERVIPFRPHSAQRSNAPFDGTTNYACDYRRWVGDRVQPHKVAGYVPNPAPFEGSSTYKGHYIPHAIHPTYSCRPDNAAFHSDAKFDDGTQYRHDYTPKPIHICEAAIIDQPTSRFRFAEFDSRGHKLYAPIQTTIMPLQLRSPIQSQQRLAMSMA